MKTKRLRLEIISKELHWTLLSTENIKTAFIIIVVTTNFGFFRSHTYTFLLKLYETKRLKLLNKRKVHNKFLRSS